MTQPNYNYLGSYVSSAAAVGYGGVLSVDDYMYEQSRGRVTQAFPPGPPTSVSGVDGTNSVQLSWTAPSDTGTAAITSYYIQYSPDAGATWSDFGLTNSTATSATVTGLGEGVTYVFRVAAVSDHGQGDYSSASSCVTTLGVRLWLDFEGSDIVDKSSAARAIEVVNTVGITSTQAVSGTNSGSFNLDKDFASFVNAGYGWDTWGWLRIQDSCAFAFSQRDYTVECRVRPSNIHAFGNWFLACGNGTCTGFAVGCDDQGGVLFRPGLNCDTVGTTGAVSANQWHHIVLCGWGDAGSVSGSSASQTAMYLNGQRIMLRGYESLTPSNGWLGIGGFHSNSATFFQGYIDDVKVTVGSALYRVPDAPTGVSGTAGEDQVSLSWTAPASAGTSSITDYVVQYSTDNSTWTTFADGTSSSASAVVTGLAGGVAHTFRVAAVNSSGQGAFSSVSSSVTPTSGSGITTEAGETLTTEAGDLLVYS
jgi:hypothetical protein